jgi:hypothetical protein
MSEVTADAKAELTAMTVVSETLAALDDVRAARVLQWAADVRGLGITVRKARGAETSAASTSENGGPLPAFESLGELDAAASPPTDADRALLGGYWFQFLQQKPDFTAYEVNVALNNLGHRLKNITSAFDTLKARKPSLVIQLKKSGTSKQSRKTYKLTVAGKQAVESMIAPHQ